MVTCFNKYARLGGFRNKVAHVSSKELAQLPRQAYVLVDCRPEKERHVSRIPNSISQKEYTENKEVYETQNKMVVTTCTIGYRSGKFALELLSSNSEARVKNHAGSIMDWCHEGLSLVDENGMPTKDVHPYGKSWIKYFPQNKGYNFIL